MTRITTTNCGFQRHAIVEEGSSGRRVSASQPWGVTANVAKTRPILAKSSTSSAGSRAVSEQDSYVRHRQVIGLSPMAAPVCQTLHDASHQAPLN
jgi:hypothetical protein